MKITAEVSDEEIEAMRGDKDAFVSLLSDRISEAVHGTYLVILNLYPEFRTGATDEDVHDFHGASLENLSRREENSDAETGSRGELRSRPGNKAEP